MSKKSFNEIEQAIKKAAEAHEPAFDGQSWEKMEALLDKEKDRRKPIAFWLWWLLPLLVGAGLVSYFVFAKGEQEKKQQDTVIQKNIKTDTENIKNEQYPVPHVNTEPVSASHNNGITHEKTPVSNDEKYTGSYVPATAGNKKTKPPSTGSSFAADGEKLEQKNMLKDKLNGKMKVAVTPAAASADDESSETALPEIKPGESIAISTETDQTGDIAVIKVDADKNSEQEIERIVDSVVKKISTDEKKKSKIARLYVIVAAGAEANGVKLFSADKITPRYGLGIGYQFNKNISVQTGFYASNKKYGATGKDYKTKHGSYWSTVDIKNIEANCRVYEIPISIVYNFTPGRKYNLFASAGLSSYIMKKEDYRLFYDHYGMPYQADVSYKGNKNLFSVLRITAGVEKKLSTRFSVVASPGLAVPLSGVGDGEVKLYSADLTIGLKFTPFRKK